MLVKLIQSYLGKDSLTLALHISGLVKIVSLTVDKRRRLKGLSAKIGLTFAVLTFSFALAYMFESPISAQTDTEDDPSAPAQLCRLIGIEISPSELTVEQGEFAELNVSSTFSPAGCADDRDISFTWEMTNPLGIFYGYSVSGARDFFGREAGAGQLILNASFQGDDDEIIEIIESVPFTVLPHNTDITISSEKFYDFERAPDTIQDNAICKGKDACIYILAGDSVTLEGRVEYRPGVDTPQWRIEGDDYNIASLSSTDSFSTRLSTVPDVAQITTLTVRFGLDLDSANVAERRVTVIVVPIWLGVRLGRCSAALYQSGTQYYALTAAHCLADQIGEEGDELEIFEKVELLIDETIYDGVLAGIDQASDLAVLLVQGYDNADLPNTRLSFSASLGDTVYAVGYPPFKDISYVGTKNLVVTSSKIGNIPSCGYVRLISGVLPMVDGITSDGSIGTDCVANIIAATPGFAVRGSSGGSVVNESGSIVGIVTSFATETVRFVYGKKEIIDVAVLNFFLNQEALDWFLDSNRRCFSNFYSYTLAERGSPENEAITAAALMDVEVGDCNENPKVTIRRVYYLQSADTPWWVYVVAVASMATLLLISISIRSRLRRRRLAMLRKGEIIVPRDELAKRVWEDHYGKATRAQDICTAWMVKEDYGYQGDYGWEIDYIVPLSHGGTNRFNNLRPLHWMNKAAKDDNPDGDWECAIRYEIDRTDTVDRDFTIPL